MSTVNQFFIPTTCLLCNSNWLTLSLCSDEIFIRANTTIVGIGLTPEGLSDAYATAELMLEMSWRNEPVSEIDSWFSGYTRRRYGSFNENALNAWKVLLPNVLNSTCKFPNRKVLISHLPSLSLTDYLWYNVSDIATSWDYLFKARNELHTKEGYRYEFMVYIIRCLFEIIWITF